MLRQGNLAAEPVDVLHSEFNARLMRSGKQVEDSIGRSAHRDVEAHRVLKSFETGDTARQHALIALIIVSFGQSHHEPPRPLEKTLSVGMCREHRAIAWQREPKRLCQAVHRIGGEHARTASAGRASTLLDRSHFFVGVALVGCSNHRIDEVERDFLALENDLTCFHRAARDEHDRDIDPHRRHPAYRE